MIKQCTKCKKTKELSEFRKDKTRKDGHQYICKKCKSDLDSQYYTNNKRKVLDSQNTYRRKKRQNDPLYKMKGVLSTRVWKAFKKKYWKKGKSTEILLGADYKTVKLHIEKQFQKGMSWENHGEWHIDHIIPLASALTKEEMINLCNYKNLQPLWALDNIKKSDSISF